MRTQSVPTRNRSWSRWRNDATIPSSMRAKFYLLVPAAFAAGVGATWLAAHAGADRPTEPGPVLTALVGASLIGCGLASWRARPENRLGPVMVLTGFLWFAGLLSEATSAPLYTLGVAIEYVFLCGFIYIVLSFPSGQLRTALDKAIVALAIAGTGLQVVAMLFGSGSGLRCGGGCGDNLIQVFHDNGFALALLNLQRALGAILTLTAVGSADVSLAARERSAAPRGHMGAAGRKRDAARAHGHGRRRPARQPAQLGSGKGVVPHARARADRGAGNVRAAAARARERGRARRPVGRAD